MDYTAVGDTTNLADRASSQLAEPGSDPDLGLPPSAWSQASSSSRISATSRSRAGSKPRPRASRCCGSVAVASGRIEALAETGLTPLVGRDRELEAALRALLRVRPRAGRGQVACSWSASGDREVAAPARVPPRPRSPTSPTLWIEGRCSSSTAPTTPRSMPIVDAVLRRSLERVRRSGTMRARARVGSTLRGRRRRSGPTWPGRCRSCASCCRCPSATSGRRDGRRVRRRSETFRAPGAIFLRRGGAAAGADLRGRGPALDRRRFRGVPRAPSPTRFPATRLLLVRHAPARLSASPSATSSYHVRVALQALSERRDRRDDRLPARRLERCPGSCAG